MVEARETNGGASPDQVEIVYAVERPLRPSGQIWGRT